MIQPVESVVDLPVLNHIALRFTLDAFGISIGLASQASIVKTLRLLNVITQTGSRLGNDALTVINWLWFGLAVGVWAVFVFLTIAKVALHWNVVEAELVNPVRVNFGFGAMLAGQLIVAGNPFLSRLPQTLFWLLFVAQVVPQVYLCGSWWFGTFTALQISNANPTFQVPIVGDFVLCALLAQFKETSQAMRSAAIGLFATGTILEFMLIMTMFRDLPNLRFANGSWFDQDNGAMKTMFLFLAPPSIAAVGLKTLSGEFGDLSVCAFGWSVFVLLILVSQLRLFWRLPFGLSSWAYTFPLTALSSSCLHLCFQFGVNSWFGHFLVFGCNLMVLVWFVLTLRLICSRKMFAHVDPLFASLEK